MTIIIERTSEASPIGRLIRIVAQLFNAPEIIGPRIVWNTNGVVRGKSGLLPRSNRLQLVPNEYFQHKFSVPDSLLPQLRKIASFEIAEHTPFEIRELIAWVSYKKNDCEAERQEHIVQIVAFTKSTLNSLPNRVLSKTVEVQLLDESGQTFKILPLPPRTWRLPTTVLFSIVSFAAAALMLGSHLINMGNLNTKIESLSQEYEKQKLAYTTIVDKKREIDRNAENQKRFDNALHQTRIDAVNSFAGLIAARSPKMHYKAISIQPSEIVISLESPNILESIKKLKVAFSNNEVVLVGPISRTSNTTETATLRVDLDTQE